MEEIVKHINDTNASYRAIGAGNAKNTDLFLDNEHYELFRDSGGKITVRFNKENLTKAILFISSILPRKYDNSAIHKEIPFSTAFVYDQLAFLDGFFTVNGVKVDSRTQVWTARKDVMKANGEIDRRFYFNGLLEDVAYTNYKGESRSAKFTIRNYIAGGYSDLHFKKEKNGIFDVWVTNALEPYNDGKEKGLDVYNHPERLPLQQIYYGAPGTGKSHEIKEKTKGEKIIRTTFHPDSDYSTFVGAYKPTMGDADVQVVPVVVNNGISLEQNKGTYKEKRITYKFVKQAFLKAYLSAWQSYADNPTNPKPQFLIIEEINRGNCAQIFGDLFQLLDRADNGFSEYPIEADTDVQQAVENAFVYEDEYKLSTKLDIEGKVVDYVSNYDSTLSEDVAEGRVLLLPPNLYIWATMNTSDQSLFPIDSAFKRRWDWVYIPIKPHDEENYRIEIGKSTYNWWGFLEKINQVIDDTTSSEDKKLGYFFVKAEDKVVKADRFVSKVLFYLWNDVFKNYGFDNPIFSKGDNQKFVFSDFFEKDGSPNTIMVNAFLNKLDETIDKDHSFVETQPSEDNNSEQTDSEA